MKNQPFPILVTITCIFLAFTLGLWIGRNTAPENIQISGIATSPIHGDKPPVSTTAEASAPQETVVFPIDINSATEAELLELPGIGETLAQRILTYRSQNGFFSAPEELLNVPGIGQAKLEAILDLITTGGKLP